MLKYSDLKIYEIAEKVGYPNLSYFSKMFKKYIGKLPEKEENNEGSTLEEKI